MCYKLWQFVCSNIYTKTYTTVPTCSDGLLKTCQILHSEWRMQMATSNRGISHFVFFFSFYNVVHVGNSAYMVAVESIEKIIRAKRYMNNPSWNSFRRKGIEVCIYLKDFHEFMTNADFRNCYSDFPDWIWISLLVINLFISQTHNSRVFRFIFASHWESSKVFVSHWKCGASIASDRFQSIEHVWRNVE